MTYDQAVDTGDRLTFTLFLAVAVHAIIIFGVYFNIDKGDKVAPTLNITLATHKSKTAPEKADFIAQHNMEGSGTLDEVKELATNRQAEIKDKHVRDIHLFSQQQATSKQEGKKKYLTTEKSNRKIALNSETDKLFQSEEKAGTKWEVLAKENPEFASLAAKYLKDKQEYANRPKILWLTSVAAKQSSEAEYLFNWAQKIEKIGNEHFPQEAIQNSIFGKLRLAVSIGPTGVVEDIEISQSSGHTILDNAAKQIVKLSSPFPPFPKEIRANKIDKLVVIRTWHFDITVSARRSRQKKFKSTCFIFAGLHTWVMAEKISDESTSFQSLRDHFLIAMPSLSDSIFCRSVTYLCDHNEHGAMGIVINQPLDITMADVFSQLSLNASSPIAKTPVLAGGPVSMQRGFVLHRDLSTWQSTLKVSDEVSLTASRDIVAALANNEGPQNAQFALGYAGWEAGQLEDELSANSWLSIPADINIMFDVPVEERWAAAAKHLGVDLNLISSVAGHA